MSLIYHKLGTFPALAAGGEVSLPLRGLPPHHTLLALVPRISVICTDDGGALGALTSADLDLVLANVITRVRVSGPAIGTPINLPVATLRTFAIDAQNGRDIAAFSTAGAGLAFGTPFIGASLGAGATATFNMDLTIPFTDARATLDPYWCAPCSDEYAEGSIYLSVGALTAAGIAVTGGNIIQTAATVDLYAVMVDAHGPYVSPQMTMLEYGTAVNPVILEPGLYLHGSDTRPGIGVGAYNPTITIEKDGKPVVQSVEGRELASGYRRHALPYAPVAGFSVDLATRAAPTFFLPYGYCEDDLKPSLGQFTIRASAGFVAGTFAARFLRPVRPEQHRALGASLGIPNPTERLRVVLGASSGSSEHEKIALFKPRWVVSGS